MIIIYACIQWNFDIKWWYKSQK